MSRSRNGDGNPRDQTIEVSGTKTGFFEWTWDIQRPKSPSVDYLIAEAHHIIDRAFNEHHAIRMLPLYSGGNDSGCSAHVASLHPKFEGKVYTINTRTGAFRTKLHQRKLCRLFAWEQEVRRSKETYEQLIRGHGCPGPGSHRYAYIRLKERVIDAWVKEHKSLARPVALCTGVRASESTRRFGYTKQIQRGGYVSKEGRVDRPHHLWVAPIVHWTSEDKRRYMRHFMIPMNPFSATLGMSLECCCGAFADRRDFGGESDERELIRKYAPDVSKKIEIIERIARESGQHCVWGTRPKDGPDVDPQQAELEMLCQSCNAKNAANQAQPT